MADDRAQEAQQPEQSQQQPQGVQVESQFVIQALQQKVAQLTNDITMAEAYIAQQQAVINELARQVAVAQEGEAAVIPMPEHQGRATKKRAPAKS